MFSTSRAKQNIEKKDIKYIPAGIHENVTFKSVRIDKSPNGNNFIEFVFEKDGATLTHTEWEPTLGGPTDTQEKLEAKADNIVSRIMQIVSCFYKEEDAVFEGDTFKSFIDWVAYKLSTVDKTKKLRVKVVYNRKGYTALPAYAKYTFIEPQELPEGKTSSITELGIDQFTRPVVADAETPVANPDPFADVKSDATTNPNDLPF